MIVDADTDEIPVGVDGEALVMRTPVRCTVSPQALRVRVPKIVPGTPPQACLGSGPIARVGEVHEIQRMTWPTARTPCGSCVFANALSQ